MFLTLLAYGILLRLVGSADPKVVVPGRIHSGVTDFGVVAGGESNLILVNSDYSTITGGKENRIDAKYALLAGGGANRVFSNYASVLGGYDNIASGRFSTILGGNQNRASGRVSMALGQSAAAHGGNSAAFSFGSDGSNCTVWEENTIAICADSIEFHAESVWVENGQPFEASAHAQLRAGHETLDRVMYDSWGAFTVTLIRAGAVGTPFGSAYTAKDTPTLGDCARLCNVAKSYCIGVAYGNDIGTETPQGPSDGKMTGSCKLLSSLDVTNPSPSDRQWNLYSVSRSDASCGKTEQMEFYSRGASIVDYSSVISIADDAYIQIATQNLLSFDPKDAFDYGEKRFIFAAQDKNQHITFKIEDPASISHLGIVISTADDHQVWDYVAAETAPTVNGPWTTFGQHGQPQRIGTVCGDDESCGTCSTCIKGRCYEICTDAVDGRDGEQIPRQDRYWCNYGKSRPVDTCASNAMAMEEGWTRDAYPIQFRGYALAKYVRFRLGEHSSDGAGSSIHRIWGCARKVHDFAKTGFAVGAFEPEGYGCNVDNNGNGIADCNES